MSASLSSAAETAWLLAAAEAVSGRHEKITPAHLLLGVLSLEKILGALPESDVQRSGRKAALAAEVRAVAALCSDAGTTAPALRRKVRRAIGSGRVAGTDPRRVSRDTECKAVFRRAQELAGSAPVTPLYLIAALIGSLSPPLREAVKGLALPLSEVRRHTSEAADAAVAPSPADGAPPAPGTSELERYGRDLSALAAAGKLGPVTGRRAELLEIVRTLARARKNTPVLVGEAGVGKTAIVEALAIRAAAGKDAAVLGGRRIVELRLGSLLAGTRYRGEFEDRLERILAELRAHPEVLVFIDELHTLVGAGRIGDGALDAANLLKPALARGELRLIGATTPAEYRRFIGQDPALERRLAPIEVAEPSDLETVEILRGLRPLWERHHGVRIADSALEAAVRLSVRFDPEHRLPDKAVDLVDRAAARCRVPGLSLRAPAAGSPAPFAAGEVTADVVAETLSEARAIPRELVAADLAAPERSRILGLEEFLRGRLVGQGEAVGQVARRCLLAFAGVAERRGPLAVFLLLGPTGVGKTECARLLAEFLFGSRDALIRLDMSEYMEEHSVAKLIGSPPGYVGHGEEGLLTSRLRGSPHTVLLLDEVEKAHPRVFDLFLQLFDEGRLTDAKGRTADAQYAIVAMTSNLGGGPPPGRVGFPAGQPAAAVSNHALEEARRFFRPEFLNRVHELVVFRPFDKRDAGEIVRRHLERLAARLKAEHGVRLHVDPAAVRHIAGVGLSAAEGARGLARTVERLVETPLGRYILQGLTRKNPSWRIVYEEGGVYVVPELLLRKIIARRDDFQTAPLNKAVGEADSE